MQAPAIDIDYGRDFSLPFGLAPTTDAGYVSALDMDVGYVLYPRRTTEPQWPPRPLEAAAIPFADGSGKRALLPASTAAALGVATARVKLEAGAIVALPLPALGVEMPAFDDGALVLRWRPRAEVPPGGLLTNGIAENLLADYLLATHAAGGDGEAARDLLRAPVVGLLRFKRYRHLELSGTALGVGASSTAGAIVIRSRAGGATPPAGRPPVLNSAVVVIENIDRTSAVHCIGRLAWSSVIRGGDVQASVALRGEGAALQRILVQAYVDYLQVARPTHRPTTPQRPDPLPLLSAVLEPKPGRKPFEGAKPKPTAADVAALIDLCITNATLRASLLDFVTTVFAEVVSGATWSEIGVAALGAAPAAALADAHMRLAALPSRSDETFVPCFAGAPVGRAAAIVVPAGQAPAANVSAQESLSPYHLEALAAAGQPAPATQAYGSMAVLRVIDEAGMDTLLTTRDFLDALVKGSHTATRFAPPLDLAALANLGHPYASAVEWGRFTRSREVRNQLDSLGAAKTARGPKLGQANIDFWSEQSGLLLAGNWPAVPAIPGAPIEAPPTPKAPFATRETRVFPSASGFDEYDIEAVLRARSVVRDGRSGNTDIPIPLFLALLDREGYRALAFRDRPAMRVNSADVGMMAAPTPNDVRAVALTNWLVFPFGLDLLTAGTPVSAASPTGFPLRHLPRQRSDLIPARFNESFASIHGRLVGLGILATDLEPLLKEGDCLDYLQFRNPGRHLPPRGMSVVLRARSAQWMAIALQMATFQWIHKQICTAMGPRHTTGNTNDAWVRVDEFAANPLLGPPPAGPNANSDERRRFIAYWALVYLGFNTSPPTWNRWVNSVPEAKIAAGIPVSVYLTHRRNSAPRNPDGLAFATPVEKALLMGQRGHMVRFAAGLDAYMRLGVNADAADLSDPDARAWPLP